jgi:reactive intermediate/imine deaminase
MSQLSRAVFAATFCVLSLPAIAAPQGVHYFAGKNAVGPFSPAVRVGDTVYVSGVIGVGADGALPAEFSAQAINAMTNLSGELALAGASMDQVYKCGVALADMKNWPAFNVVYARYFKPGRLPVRMASGVNGLAKEAAVEVECEAYSPQ